MKHQKLIATLLGISAFSYSISQTKPKSKDDSYSKALFDEAHKEASERAGMGMVNSFEREVSIEIPITNLTNILIETETRPIEIKTWSESKVKISANILEGNNSNTSNSLLLLESMNVHSRLINNSLTIKTGLTNNQIYNPSQDAPIAKSGWPDENTYVIKKVVTIYIPKESNLKLESKYSDITVKKYFKKLNIDITNGSLELGNINSLTLRSKYANVSINEVQNGEIDFINGKLSIQSLGEVDLDTKYSRVEIGNAKKLNFKSTNDEYDLEDVATIEGSKNYGSLRISKLTESIQLDGTNADVKIKTIGSQTKSIWIDNKYADLRIPLKNITNFSLTYDGTYSTIYKNFIAAIDKYHSSENKKIDLVEADDSKITTGDIQNSKFKASVGSGKDAKIAIKCQNCTVDFR
jgi:hypothetical protein